MPLVIPLDSGPLGLITQAKGHLKRETIRGWYERLTSAGVIVAVPEIASYEVRRELFRAGNARALLRLRSFRDETLYLPITTAAMERAAELWAQARTVGGPGASDESLDADCVLAAQAERARGRRDQVVIATDNLKHFRLFSGIDAQSWQQITP
jgi:predicted nucleic acid-binding protein